MTDKEILDYNQKVYELAKARLQEMQDKGIQGDVSIVTPFCSFQDYEKIIKQYGKENVFHVKTDKSTQAVFDRNY